MGGGLVVGLVTAGAWAADPDPAAVPDGMAGHFHQAALLMLAVAVRDRGEAKDLAKGLGRNKAAPIPLRDAAKEVASKVGNPRKAAAAVAELGRTCAECHLAGMRGPVPHDTGVVPGDDPTERHIMAAMFVWIGLVTPVEQPYDLGLEELVPPVFLESSDKVRSAAEALRVQVDAARAAESWAERTARFGEVLATCAECHRRARVGR